MAGHGGNEARNEQGIRISSPAWIEMITNMLECPVCLDLCLPPIYKCQNSHIACGRCLRLFPRCILCKATFAGNYNAYYEGLVEMTRLLPCKYAVEGCRDVVDGKFLRSHQANCNYGPIGCLDTACRDGWHGYESLIPCSDYLSHYKLAHQLQLCSGKAGTLINDRTPAPGTGTPNCRWPLGLVQFQEHSFFIVTKRDGSHIFIWAQYFGPQEKASQFRLLLSLEEASAKPDFGPLSWEGPVHSIRKPSREICNEGKCLSTTSEAIKWFMKESRSGPFWEVNFEILDLPNMEQN